MARTQFSASVYDKKHQRNIGLIKIKLNAIYNSMCKEAAAIGLGTHFSDPNKEFHLSDFPQANKKMDALLHSLASEVESLIHDGNDKAWQISTDKNNAMVASLSSHFQLPKEKVNEWSRRSVSALNQFQGRTVQGMNLSQRVWDFVQHDKQNLEYALELGLAEGKSAAKLSRDVREYLNEPHKLFRRVRDRDGNLRLSKNAAAYHPGQGVYRSSYKNALRMTITENNMAYRTADHVAWQEMPFVIGQTVKLSDNHTCKGVKGMFFDVCDEMQGDYPKEFKFTGWHPHCRCFVIAKMPTLDELDKYSQLTDEEQANYHFDGEVKDVPQGFKDWMQNNAERIANAKNMPYFIKDNYAGGVPQGGFKWEAERQRMNTLEKAKIRHEARTPQQIQDIQDRWALRQDEMQYSPEQRAMFREIEKELGIKRGFSMPHLRADMQNANPNYFKSEGYRINCQTCAPAYQLRRWGFDVTANPNKKGNLSEYLSSKSRRKEAWLDAQTKRGKAYTTFNDWLSSKGYKQMTPARYKEYFDEVCKNDGLYEIGVSWKGGGGHRTVIERRKGKIRYVEPQIDNSKYSKRYWDDYDNLCEKMSVKPNYYDGAMKVDDGVFNIKKFAPIFSPNKAVPLHRQRLLNDAAIRHEKRSVSEIRDIKKRWDERKKANDVINKLKSITDAKKLAEFRDEYNLITLHPTPEVRKAFIDRAAEIRHASRKDAEVLKRFETYRKRIELERKTAENIIKVAKDYPYVESGKLSELLQKNRTTELVAETKKLAQEMSSIKKWEMQVSEYIPDVKMWEKQFSMSEIEAVRDNVVKNLNKWENAWSTDPWLPTKYASKEEYLLHKISTEIIYVGTTGKTKYTTWQLAESAYANQHQIVSHKVWKNGAEQKIQEMEAFAASHSKSPVFAKKLAELKDAYSHATPFDKSEWQTALTDIELKKHDLELRDAQRARKKAKTNGTIDFKPIGTAKAQKMFADFENNRLDTADDVLRKLTKQDWSKLTDEEKLLLTKYTQTYSYVNEPMRKITYSGGRPRDEFLHDMPIMTEALSKQVAPFDMVVRRGTADFPIELLGKRLSDLKPGDEFIDGAFLSTAVRVDKGFFQPYNLEIIVPKGAQGMYAEPFTHYNDAHKHDYGSNTLWDGIADESMGAEREWIGQRGSKFKVLEVKGNTIYLQMIGQLYEQTATPEIYFRY